MTSESQQPQMGLTFEQVWAALMENREQIRKTSEQIEKIQNETAERQKKTSEQIEKMQKETAERQKEAAERQKEAAERQKEAAGRYKETEKAVKETFEHIKEMQKETDKQVKRMSKTLGGLGNSLGQLIETLIAARLWEKFDVYKYNLKRSYQRVTLYDENNEELTEIDILLSNGEYVMAVEVKENFHRLDEVDHHIKRMELIKKYPPAECKGKKLLGAVAGGIVTKDAKDYAHKAGFFVLELTGESVQIAKAPAGFTPRQW